MPDYEDHVEEDEFYVDDPEDVEFVDVEITRKHILLALAGITVAGLIIFCGWEYVNHKLRSRRMENLTGNIAEIMNAGADVMYEVRHMPTIDAPPEPQPRQEITSSEIEEVGSLELPTT